MVQSLTVHVSVGARARHMQTTIRSRRAKCCLAWRKSFGDHFTSLDSAEQNSCSNVVSSPSCEGERNIAAQYF